MNKIYKVIYSKVKRCYVVVSEIAKGNTKSASSKVSAGSTTTALASLVLATLLLVGGTSTVYADATFVKLDNVGGKDGGALTTGDVVTHNQNDYYTGVKAPSQLTGYDDNNRPFSVILGFNGDSKAANWNQYYWHYNANNNFWKWTNSLGTQFTPNVGRYSVILGYRAGTTGDYNTIIGPNAKAVATLGANNTYGTTGISKATAIGDNATAIADAFGINAEYRKTHSNIDDIEGGQQLAIGSNSVASGQATALGNDVYAVGIGSIAIGSDDNPAYYKDLITEYDKDTYFKSVYNIMNNNAGGEKYGFGTAGTAKYSPTLAQGYGSIAIGTRSLAYDIGTTAVGALAFALKPGSTAIGAKSRAEGDKSISIGNRALTFADNTIAVGNEVQVVQQGGTGYGYKAYASGQNSIAIGTEVYANSKITNAENQYNVSSSSSSSSSITPSQENKNDVSGVVRQEDGKNNAIVIGKNSAAIGGDTIALGKNTTAKEDNSIAVGSGAKTYGTNSIAIGVDAKVNNTNATGYTGDKSMAIGYGAFATLDNSVALGVNSQTDYTQAELDAKPWTPQDAFLTPTSSNTGVISVGASGKERRVVRVAAGASDTDAVNVGQLKAALEKVNMSVNGLSTSNKFHYRSINNTDGSQAGAFEKRVDVRNAYDEYVKLDKQYLTYLARKQYNNETFDQTVLDSIKAQLDKYKAIGTASSVNFEEKAANLKTVEDTITLGVTGKTYKGVLADIEAAATAAENADLGTQYAKNTLETEKAANNFDNAGAKGKDSIAYGFKASVSNDSDQGIAIGLQAEVKNNSDDGIAIGKTAVVYNSQNAMAVGLGAQANSSGQAVVLGKGRTVTGSGNSVAIGQEAATTSSEKSVGVGFGNTISSSASGVAIGDSATLSSSGSGVAIGKGSQLSSAQNSVAIGLNALSNTSPYSIAIGDNAQNLENNATTGGTLADSSNMQNIAIGNVAKTNNSVAGIALGKGAKINDGATSGSVSNAIAIGTEAKVNADKSIAIGSTANVSGSVESIAIGDRAKVTNSNYSTSIGINNEAKNGQTLLMLGTNLKSDNTRSYGSTDPNANNNSKSILMGNDLMIRDGSKKVIFIGNEKDGSVGGEVTRVVDHSDFAIAIGSGNIIQGDNRKIRPTGANNEAEEWDSSKYSVTLGSYNTVTSSMYGITIGNNNSHGNNTYYARGKNYRTYKNVVIGNNNAIFGTNDSVYIGNNIQQNGDYPTYKFYNIAIGYNVRPGGVESITMGKDATTKENKAIAIGSGAVANKQYNVVLGAGSQDATSYNNGDTFGGTYTSRTTGITKSYADGNDIRVVSVGGGTGEAPVTRRIVNVTGGKNDTDAVNMAQLKSLATNQISFATDGSGTSNVTTKENLGNVTDAAYKGQNTIVADTTQTRLQFGIKGWVPPATTGTAATTTTTPAEVQSIETTASGKNVFIKVKDGGITEAKLSQDVKDKLNANVITKGTVTVNNGITKTGTGQVVGGDLTLSLDFASAVDKQNGNENKVVKAGQVKDALDLKADKNAANITTSDWVTKLSTGASLTTPTGVLVTDTAVKSALDDKANKNLGNIDATGENKIKDEAIKAVKVAVTGNGLTLNTTTNESTTHEKTYTLSLDFANAIDKGDNNNKPVSAGQVADALAGKVNTSDLNTTLGGYTKIDGTNLTNIAKDKWAEALGNGTIGGNTDSNLVTGSTVKTALNNKLDTTRAKFKIKGDDTTTKEIDLNVATPPNVEINGDNTTIEVKLENDKLNVKAKTGEVADNVTTLVTGSTVKSYVDNALSSYAKLDGSNLTATGGTGGLNVTNWANALGTGTVAANDENLVKGKTVKSAIDDLTIKYKANDTGNNTVKLTDGLNFKGTDNQITASASANGVVTYALAKAVTDKLALIDTTKGIADKDLSNITETGKAAITNLVLGEAKTATAGDTNLATVDNTIDTTTKAKKIQVGVSKNAVKDAAVEAVKVAVSGNGLTLSPSNNESTTHEKTYTLSLDFANAIDKNGNANKPVSAGQVADALAGKVNTSDLNTTLGGYTKIDGTNLTNIAKDKWATALGNGTIGGNTDGNLVTGSTVKTALDSKLDTSKAKFKFKGDDSATKEIDLNVATPPNVEINGDNTTIEVKLENDKLNVKAKTGEVADNVTALVTGGKVKSYVDDALNDYAKLDGSNLAATGGTGGLNVTNWANALGTGTVAASDNNLVKGSTVKSALNDLTLKYKANDTGNDTVKLTDGLNFKGTANQITASTSANGVVTYGLDSAVTNKLDLIDTTKGIADKDLSNVSPAGKTVIQNIAKDAVKLESGKNTTVSSTVDADLNTVYTVDVNSDLEDINSIKNSDGTTTLNITDGGLTLNDKKIDGLAEATLSSTSTEAVSGKQLVAKAKELASALGGGAAVSDTDGTFTQPTYKLKTQAGGDIGTTVGATADGGNGGTYNNVGAALSAIDSGLAKLKNDGLNFAGDTATTTQTAKLTKKVQITGGTDAANKLITSSVTADTDNGVIVTLGIDTGNLTTKLGTGTIDDKATKSNLVTGATVKEYVDNAINNVTGTSGLGNKADKDGSNLVNTPAGGGAKTSALDDTAKQNWATALGSTTVTKDENKLITSGAVHTAIENVKTTGFTVSGNTDTNKITTQLSKNVQVKGDGTIINVTAAADTDNGATLTIGLDKGQLATAITTDATAKTNLQNGLTLGYKVNGNNAQTTSLTNGLDFLAGTGNNISDSTGVITNSGSAKAGITILNGKDGKVIIGLSEATETTLKQVTTNKDSINNITNEINTLREGSASPMVYTTEDGTKVTKINNKFYKTADVQGKRYDATSGKFYDNSQFTPDGKLKPNPTELPQQPAELTSPKVVISAVNPNSTTPTTDAMKLNNVSGLTNGKTSVDFTSDTTGKNTSLKVTNVYQDPQGADQKSEIEIGNKGKITGVNSGMGTVAELISAVDTTKDGKETLGTVATLKDVQTIAKAGINFKDGQANTVNNNTINAQLGNTVIIKGKDDTTYNGTNYSAENLVTHVDQTAKTITIAMLKTPKFDALNLGDVKLTPSTDGGKLTLSNTKQGATDTKVVLDGLKEGTTRDAAATKGSVEDVTTDLNKVKNALGLNGADGTNGQTSTGPAGKDGLDGKSILDKVQAGRDGLSGSMVYTDKDGNRIDKVGDKYYKDSDVKDALTTANVKLADDGKYYPSNEVDSNGKHTGQTAGKSLQDVLNDQGKKEVPKNKMQISAVNPDGTATNPTAMGNVASGLGLDNVKGATSTAITEAKAKEAVAGTNGLLTKSGKDLNNVATVGDLQAVAQAGLDVTDGQPTAITNNVAHLPLGTKLKIQGKANTTADTNYSSDNLATMVDSTNKTVTISMLKTPKFDAVELGKVKLTPSADGSKLTLSNTTTNPAPADTKVVLDGLKEGTNRDAAATKGSVDDIKKALGIDGTNGTNGTGTQGSTGPAGKDGLDGKSILDKVQAGRDGLSGSMVYTDKDGNRIDKVGDKYYKDSDVKDALTTANVKLADDGKYYPSNEVDSNGKHTGQTAGKSLQDVLNDQGKKEVPKNKMQISAVNPDGTATNPTAMGNVASGLGLDNVKGATSTAITEAKAKEAVAGTNGLLTKSGKDLNNVATVGDLQALAQAGLDITDGQPTAITNNVAHLPLGTKLKIQGKADTTADNSYSSDNLATMVDSTNKTVTISMLKTPKFDAVELGNVKLTPSANGEKLTLSNTTTNPAPDDTKVVLDGVKEGTTADSVATKGSVDDIKKALGLDGTNGTNGTGTQGSTGPAGKDGLDGKTIMEQIQAGRDGLSGNMVYTDKDGNRLDKVGDKYYKVDDVKAAVTDGGLKLANDGKYYPANDVNEKGEHTGTSQGKTLTEVLTEQNKTEVKTTDMKISAINPDGTATTPTIIGNVADGVKDNDAVNVKQLNALKSSLTDTGLTFTNGTTEKTTKLGKKVTIKGGTGNSEYITSTITQDADGNTSFELGINTANLTNALGTGTIGSGDTNNGGKATDNNLVTGTTVNTAINNVKEELQNAIDKVQGQIGPQGATGIDGTNGTSGKDGQNGKTLGQKVQAGRDGLTGSMVYTDKDGNRLEKAGDKYYKADEIAAAGLKQANDGKYYNSSDVEADGTPKANASSVDVDQKMTDAGKKAVEPKDMQVSAVNPDGSTTAPTKIGNVADGVNANDAVNKGQLDALKSSIEDGTIVGKMSYKVNDNPANATKADFLNFVAGDGEKTTSEDAQKGIVIVDGGAGKVIIGLDKETREKINAIDQNIVEKGVADKDLSNISTNGKTVVKNLAKEAVKVAAGANVTVTPKEEDGNITYTVAVNKDLKGITSITNGDDTTEGTKITLSNDGVSLNDKKITGLANGDVTKDSTDAINGSQLYNSNKEISLALGSGFNQATGQIEEPEYELKSKKDGATYNNIKDALAAIDSVAAKNREIIKDTADATDASKFADDDNKGKLATAGAVTKYVDTRFEAFGNDVNKVVNNLQSNIERVDSQASAGTASAMAAATIPQVQNTTNRNAVGIGFGNYRGQSAIAVGISGMNHSRDILYKASLTFDSSNSVGASAGIGFTFGSKTPKSDNIYRENDYNERLNKQQEEIVKLNSEKEEQNNKIKSLEEQNNELRKQIQELAALIHAKVG